MATRKPSTATPKAPAKPRAKVPSRKDVPRREEIEGLDKTKPTGTSRTKARANKCKTLEFDPKKLTPKQKELLDKYRIPNIIIPDGSKAHKFAKGQFKHPDLELVKFVAMMTAMRMPISEQRSVLGLSSDEFADQFGDVVAAFRFPSPIDEANIVRMSALGYSRQMIADALKVSTSTLKRNAEHLFTQGRLESYNMLQVQVEKKIKEGYWPAIEYNLKTRAVNLESDYYVPKEKQQQENVNVVLTIGNQTVKQIQSELTGTNPEEPTKVNSTEEYDDDAEYTKLLERLNRE